MARIDLVALAEEYGLHVEKSDFGSYGQWKDAKVNVYLDREHTRGKPMLSAVYPPVEIYAKYPCTENISVRSDLYRERYCQPGIPKFHSYMAIYNDDFNERWLREIIENTLEQYHTCIGPKSS